MIERLGLGPDSRVVEVASNDGYLLRHFVARGVPVLGVDPARNVAEAARGPGRPDAGRVLRASRSPSRCSPRTARPT